MASETHAKKAEQPAITFAKFLVPVASRLYTEPIPDIEDMSTREIIRALPAAYRPVSLTSTEIRELVADYFKNFVSDVPVLTEAEVLKIVESAGSRLLPAPGKSMSVDAEWSRYISVKDDLFYITDDQWVLCCPVNALGVVLLSLEHISEGALFRKESFWWFICSDQWERVKNAIERAKDPIQALHAFANLESDFSLIAKCITVVPIQ